MRMVPVTVFSRAAQYLSAGRMQPAGRRLDSTGLQHAVTCQHCDTHYSLVGIEPTTLRLLARRASATNIN